MFNFKNMTLILDEMSQKEYPNVPKLPKHEKYMSLVSEYIEGEIGEYVSINQYIYESSKFSRLPDVKKMFNIIIEQKIRHLKILNEIIINLGGESKIKDTIGKEAFDKYKLYETKDFFEALKYNIGLLDKKIEKYTELVEITNNDELKEIYEHIISDELTIKKVLQMI